MTILRLCLLFASSVSALPDAEPKLLTGRAALGDWTRDAPGVRRKITVADLPPPNETRSAISLAHVVSPPAAAQLQVPAGFKVEEYARSFSNPRFLLTAPNGDIFVTESEAERISVLRDTNGDGKPDRNERFVKIGLNQPFGIAFYPPGGLLRGGGHWTRDIVFSPDGKKMFVSIGSRSNVSDNVAEANRARIFEFDPDGTNQKVFASGIRNAVGIAFRPHTNELWMSTNERDGLGDDLVPDYISHVERGGFYGWPWFYLGKNQDPRHRGAHPELADKVIVPDVLLQSHSASLNLCFYDGTQFPTEYRGDIFAALHGSWNRSRRTGYKIIRVPIEKASGKATGEYEDFVTGFVTQDGKVWGRPVGIAVAKDGSLLFSEDGNDTIWRVSYAGKAD